MTYTFNFTPTITVTDANGQPQQVPHLFDMLASQYIAEQLMARVNTDNPELDYRIANELKSTNCVDLNEQELEYLISIITSLQVDNLYKGQLLEILQNNVD
jgi:hypothetical protein